MSFTPANVSEDCTFTEKQGCKTAGEARLVQWVGNLQATAATDAWDLPEKDASDRKQVLSP